MNPAKDKVTRIVMQMEALLKTVMDMMAHESITGNVPTMAIEEAARNLVADAEALGEMGYLIRKGSI